MNWKEQFDKEWDNHYNLMQGQLKFWAKDFFFHQLEKLIEEIENLRDAIRSCPSPNIPAKNPAEHLKWASLIQRIDAMDKADDFKQQLKDKWL